MSTTSNNQILPLIPHGIFLLRTMICLASFGIFLGFLFSSRYGDLALNPIQNEISLRIVDFMHYARHNLVNEYIQFHPIYEELLRNNFSLPYLLSYRLIDILGQETLPRILISAIHYGYYGLGVPFFVYVISNNARLAFLSSLLIFILPAGNEHIYGYGLNPKTGDTGVSLFFLIISLIILKKNFLSIVLIALHIWTHPTSAALYFPLYFIFLSFNWFKAQITDLLPKHFIHLLLFASPILMMMTFFFLEKMS